MSNVINLLSDDEDDVAVPSAAVPAAAPSASIQIPVAAPSTAIPAAVPPSAAQPPTTSEMPSWHPRLNPNRLNMPSSLPFDDDGDRSRSDDFTDDYNEYDEGYDSFDGDDGGDGGVGFPLPNSYGMPGPGHLSTFQNSNSNMPSSSSRRESNPPSQRTQRITLTSAQVLASLPKSNGAVMDLTADSDDDANRNRFPPIPHPPISAAAATTLRRTPMISPPPGPRLSSGGPTGIHSHSVPLATKAAASPVSAAVQHVAKRKMEKKRKADEMNNNNNNNNGSISISSVVSEKPTLRTKVKKEFQTESVPFGRADLKDEVVEVTDPDAREVAESNGATSVAASSSGALEQGGDDDDMLEIVGTGGNMIGLMDMPHQRESCCVAKFTAIDIERAVFQNGNFVSTSEANNNISMCPQCYCFVCDVIASECLEWKFHCHASYKSPRWRKEKDSRKSSLFQRMSRSHFLRFYATNRIFFIGYISDGISFDDVNNYNGRIITSKYDFYVRFLQHIKAIANAELASSATPSIDSLVSVVCLLLLAFKHSMQPIVMKAALENMPYLTTAFTVAVMNNVIDSDTKEIIQTEAAKLFQINGFNKAFLSAIPCNPAQVLLVVMSADKVVVSKGDDKAVVAWYDDDPSVPVTIPLAVTNASKNVLKIIISALIYRSCDRAVDSLLVRSPELIMGACIAYLYRDDNYKSHLKAVMLAQMPRLWVATKTWLGAFSKQVYSKVDDDSLASLPLSRVVFLLECVIREDTKLVCPAIVGKLLKALCGMHPAVFSTATVKPMPLVHNGTMRAVFAFLSTVCPLKWIKDPKVVPDFVSSACAYFDEQIKNTNEQGKNSLLSAIVARVIISPHCVRFTRSSDSGETAVDILHHSFFPFNQTISDKGDVVVGLECLAVVALECLVDDIVSNSTISEFKIESVVASPPIDNVKESPVGSITLSRAVTMRIACCIGRALINKLDQFASSEIAPLFFISQKVVFEWANIDFFVKGYPTDTPVSHSFNALSMRECMQLLDKFSTSGTLYFNMEPNTGGDSADIAKGCGKDAAVVKTVWKSFCASYYLGAFVNDRVSSNTSQGTLNAYLVDLIKTDKFETAFRAMFRLLSQADPPADCLALAHPLNVIEHLSGKCKHMLGIGGGGSFSAANAAAAAADVNALRSVIGHSTTHSDGGDDAADLNAALQSTPWRFWRYTISRLMKVVLGEKTVSTVYLSLGDWESVLKYLDTAVDFGLFLGQLKGVLRSDISCSHDARTLSELLVLGRKKYAQNITICTALRELASSPAENVLDGILEHSPLSGFDVFETQPSSAFLCKICKGVKLVQLTVDQNKKLGTDVLLLPEFKELREVLRRMDLFKKSLSERAALESKEAKNSGNPNTFSINMHVRDVVVKADEIVSLYILGLYTHMGMLLRSHFPYLAVIGTREPGFKYTVTDNPLEPFHRVNICNSTVQTILGMEISAQKECPNGTVFFTLLGIILPWLPAWLLTSNAVARETIANVIELMPQYQSSEAEGRLLMCELNLYMQCTHENVTLLYDLLSKYPISDGSGNADDQVQRAADGVKARVTSIIPKFFQNNIIRDVDYLRIACAFFDKPDVSSCCNVVGSSFILPLSTKVAGFKSAAAGTPLGAMDHDDQLKDVVMKLLELSKGVYEHYRYIFFCRVSMLVVNFLSSLPREVREGLRCALQDDLLDRLNSGSASATKGSLCFEGGGFHCLGDTAKLFRLVVLPSLENYSACTTCAWFEEVLPLLGCIVRDSPADLVNCLPVFILKGHFRELFASVYGIIDGIYDNLNNMHRQNCLASLAAHEEYDKCLACDALNKKILSSVVHALSTHLDAEQLTGLITPEPPSLSGIGIPADIKTLYYLFQSDCTLVFHGFLLLVVTLDGMLSEDNPNDVELTGNLNILKTRLTLILADKRKEFSMMSTIFDVCIKFSSRSLESCAQAVNGVMHDLASSKLAAVKVRADALFGKIFSMMAQTPSFRDTRLSKFYQICSIRDNFLFTEIFGIGMPNLLTTLLLGPVLPPFYQWGGAPEGGSVNGEVGSAPFPSLVSPTEQFQAVDKNSVNVTVTRESALRLLRSHCAGSVNDTLGPAVAFIGSKASDSIAAALCVETIILLAFSSPHNHTRTDLKSLVGYAAVAKGEICGTLGAAVVANNKITEGIDLWMHPKVSIIIDLISNAGAAPDTGYLFDLKHFYAQHTDASSLSTSPNNFLAISTLFNKMKKSNLKKSNYIRKNAGNIFFKAVLMKMVTEAIDINCMLCLLSLDGLATVEARDECSPALLECVEFTVAKNNDVVRATFQIPIFLAISTAYSHDLNQQLIKPLHLLHYDSVARVLFFNFESDDLVLSSPVLHNLIMAFSCKLEHLYDALLRHNRCKSEIKNMGYRVVTFLSTYTVTKDVSAKFSTFCNSLFRALRNHAMDLWSDFISTAKAKLKNKGNCRTVLSALSQPVRYTAVPPPNRLDHMEF